MELAFATQSYQSRSLPLSAQRAVNCLAERQPQGAKSQMPLFGAPGLTRWTTVGSGPIRGMWKFRDALYVVSGGQVARVNSSGGYKIISLGHGQGTASYTISGTNVVSMSDNGQQMMIVNGVAGYIVGNTDQVIQIRNPNFNSADTVLFYDGYFIVNVRDTNEGAFSALFDGTSWSGLDFFSAEAKPDRLQAVLENLELLFLFGQKHIEMWYDAGTADTPFQRYAGGVIERGLAAPLAAVQQDDALFFLGSDRVFYRLQGNTAIRVSTHAIETAFTSYGDISDASCYTYTIEGHKIVGINFPSVPHTWEFDISTQLWHERESWDANNNSLGRWRGNCAIEIYDKVLIGDAFTGDISILDWNVSTELGNTMQWKANSVPLHADKKRLFIRRLELDMETGTAPASGPGSNPQAMLRWSKDGGKTWTRQQSFRSLGKIGEFLRRLRWLSMGYAYQWVFELTVADPIKRTLIAAHLDSAPGSS